MNTYYFNNSKRVRNGSLIVITEATFREIKDNFACGTIHGSWCDHWLWIEAKNLKEARRIIAEKWFN